MYWLRCAVGLRTVSSGAPRIYGGCCFLFPFFGSGYQSDMTTPPARFLPAENLADLAAQASSLFAAAEQDSFDLGAEWFKLLIGHGLPNPSQAIFGVVSEKVGISCVLPMLKDGRCLRSLSTYYSSLFRPLAVESLAAHNLASIFREAKCRFGVTSVRLHAMDPGHASFALTMAAMREAGLSPFSFSDFGNWYLPAEGVDFKEYLAGLPSRVRNTVRRREKKLLHDGGTLRILTGPEDVETAVDAWAQIYGHSWKKPEPYPEFVPELLRLASRRGWLRFGLAELAGAPIAAQIWIINGGRAAIYKLAYDETYAKYSAGTILTARLMQQVLDVDRVSEVDYLIGDDAYKQDWMSHRRERMGIIAFDPNTLRGALGIARQSLGEWRKRARSRVARYRAGE